MKKIRQIRIDGNLVLGSTVIITVILDYNTVVGDTVKISLEDPSDNVKVNNADMTQLSDNVYQYFYQSSITADDEGVWVATIKTTSGGNTIYEAKDFELIENPLEF